MTACGSQAWSIGTNVSFGNGTGGVSQTCNQSMLKPPPYSPEATAAFATAITLMMVFTIFGNILVIIAVLTSRSLRGPQNLFLVSLAAADILVATLIIPFSLANELMGYWYFRSAWCEIYLALDVLFCTSSIVHLCAISLDRYLSVSRAVRYGAQRTQGRIKAAILVVWLISAIISFPPLLSMNKSQGGAEWVAGGDGPSCQLNNERWYILYSTIGSFFAPCLIMILVYVRIYQIAKQHARCPPGEPRKESPAGALPRKACAQVRQNGARGGSTSAAQRPPNLAVSPAPQTRQAKPYKNSSVQLEIPSPSHAPALTPTTPSPTLDPTLAITGQQKSVGSHQECRKPNRAGTRDGDSGSSSGSDTERGAGLGGDGASSVGGSPVGGPLPSPSAQKCSRAIATTKGTMLATQRVRLEGTPNTARRKAIFNREKRLTFVLAVVIGVFVLCWFPFFFTYSLKAVCPDACTLPEPLFKFFFWIGYCNSSLNPLIYTIFNKDFRRAFKKILCKNTKGTSF